MKFWAIAAACAAIIIPVVPHVAVAQGVWGGPGACGVTPVQTGLGANMVVDSTTGNLCVGGAGSGGSTVVSGNVSNASSGVATTTTNVPSVSYNYGFGTTTWDQLRTAPNVPTTGVGLLGAGLASVFMTTSPTYTNGQFGMVQMSPQGGLGMGLYGGTAWASAGAANLYAAGNASGVTVAASGIVSQFNTALPAFTAGQYGVVQMTANGSLDTALTPTSGVNSANVPTATAAVGSNLIVKGTPGNLYSWVVTSGASAGYVMIFNATTLPADGAVTPTDCRVIAANSTIGSGNYDIPERYTAGIVIGFSTTGCFTKTASATAYIRATFQ